MDEKDWKAVKMNNNAYEKLIELQYRLFQKTGKKLYLNEILQEAIDEYAEKHLIEEVRENDP